MRFNDELFKKELLEYSDDTKVRKFIKKMETWELGGFVNSYLFTENKFYNNPDGLSTIHYCEYIIRYDLFGDLLEFIEKIMKYYE